MAHLPRPQRTPLRTTRRRRRCIGCRFPGPCGLQNGTPPSSTHPSTARTRKVPRFASRLPSGAAPHRMLGRRASRWSWTYCPLQRARDGVVASVSTPAPAILASSLTHTKEPMTRISPRLHVTVLSTMTTLVLSLASGCCFSGAAPISPPSAPEAEESLGPWPPAGAVVCQGSTICYELTADQARTEAAARSWCNSISGTLTPGGTCPSGALGSCRHSSGQGAMYMYAPAFDPSTAQSACQASSGYGWQP